MLEFLYILAISSLGVLWYYNGRLGRVTQKYAFLGALRSAAQMVSYEVSVGLILINVYFVPVL